MTKGSNKQMSSLGFSLQKMYDRLLTSKPSLFIVASITVVVSLILLSGGVYNILTSNAAIVYISSSGQIIIYYPSLSDQFILESILVMIFSAMGVGGFLVAYRSTKNAYNPRQAYLSLLIGCALLLIAVLLLENGLLSKFNLG